MIPSWRGSGPDITSDKVDGAKRVRARLSRNVVFTSPCRTFRANWNERPGRAARAILQGRRFPVRLCSSRARHIGISISDRRRGAFLNLLTIYDLGRTREKRAETLACLRFIRSGHETNGRTKRTETVVRCRGRSQIPGGVASPM